MQNAVIARRLCAADRGALRSKSADAGANRKDGFAIRGLSTAFVYFGGEPITPAQILEVL